jgi:hypothetical protein
MLRRAFGIGLLLQVFLAMASGSAAAEGPVEGLDVIKALLGKSVAFTNSDGTSIYYFDTAIKFRLRRPAPYNDEIKGLVARGIDSSKVCMSYGKVIAAECFQLVLKGKRLIKTTRYGYQTVGEVQTAVAKPVTKGDPVICERLLTIANAALKTNGFDKLVNTKIDPNTSEDPGVPGIYFSKVELGECLIDTTVEKPRHVCMIPMKENAAVTLELYKTVNIQMQRCLGEMITASDVKLETVLNATNNKTAASHYKLGEHVNFDIQLGPSGRCLDLPYDGCTEKYGIYVKTTINN